MFGGRDINGSEPNARVYYKDRFHKQRVETSLVIQSVTLADDGNYTCGVITPSGHVEDYIYLRVKKGMLYLL